jgi:hypothetical protein
VTIATFEDIPLIPPESINPLDTRPALCQHWVYETKLIRIFDIHHCNSTDFAGIMARGIEGNEIATPRSSATKAKPATASKSSKQQSIAGFFSKRATVVSSPATQSVASVTEKVAVSSPIVATQAKRQSSTLAVSRNKENGPNVVHVCD